MFSLKSISEGGADVEQYTIRCAHTPAKGARQRTQMEVKEYIKIIEI